MAWSNKWFWCYRAIFQQWQRIRVCCKFIMSCFMTTIQAFHIYGFHTIAVVCDGASANLKAIKYLTMGKSGAYGINEDPHVDDPHHVKTWMLNPWTNEKLFFIPCPSHQVLINLCRFSWCNFNELSTIFKQRRLNSVFLLVVVKLTTFVIFT